MLSNFDFLDSVDADVWQACREAEWVFPIPRLTLLACRVPLQLMLRRVWKQENEKNQLPKENQLAYLIGWLKRADFLGSERETLIQGAICIQRAGNRAAHETLPHEAKDEPTEAALRALRALHHIACWYAKLYGNGSCKITAFQTPMPDSQSADKLLEITNSILAHSDTLFENADEPALETELRDSHASGPVESHRGTVQSIDANGRYRFVRELASGGMGKTSLATDTLVGCPVVIKRILPEYARSEQLLKRFLREGATARTLGSPSIVRVFDVGVDQTGPFIVMEFLEGSTLRSVLASAPNSRLEVHQALEITKSILGGLREAHAKRLVHRDIKPENIMLARGLENLREPGAVKLIDWGLVRPLEQMPGEVPLTLEGAAPGTPGYRSPEVARGEPATEQSDIYGVALVLYEMLTGWHPRMGDVRQDPRERKEIPERLRSPLAKALDSDPLHRPPSCEHFENELSSELGQHFQASYDEWLDALVKCWSRGQSSQNVLDLVPKDEWPNLVEQARDSVPEAVVLCALRAYRDGEWSAEMRFGRVIPLLERVSQNHRYPLASYLRGLIFLQGRCGENANFVAAATLLERAAKVLPFANFDLGIMAELGLGEATNLKKAADLYFAAEKAGHEGAHKIHDQLWTLISPGSSSWLGRAKSRISRFFRRTSGLKALR